MTISLVFVPAYMQVQLAISCWALVAALMRQMHAGVCKSRQNACPGVHFALPESSSSLQRSYPGTGGSLDRGLSSVG